MKLDKTTKPLEGSLARLANCDFYKDPDDDSGVEFAKDGPNEGCFQSNEIPKITEWFFYKIKDDEEFLSDKLIKSTLIFKNEYILIEWDAEKMKVMVTVNGIKKPWIECESCVRVKCIIPIHDFIYIELNQALTHKKDEESKEN